MSCGNGYVAERKRIKNLDESAKPVTENNSLRLGRAGTLVYFDTNVFDPIHGVSEAQENLILGAIRSQRFRLVFDLDCFLEPLLTFRAVSTELTGKASGQLTRMLKWCDLRRIVRPAETLLAQAVLSYSVRRARVEEFLDSEQLDEQVKRELQNWDAVGSPQSKFWQSITRNVQRERERYERSFTDLLEELGPRDGFSPGATIPAFGEFWEEHKGRVAQSFVEGVGGDLKQSDLWELCVRQGINALLDIRCMRLAVGATVALMYSHFYNEGRQIPKVRRSDAADIRHAIAASAAEIFVTNDTRLCKRLSAISIKQFRLVDLKTFLATFSV